MAQNQKSSQTPVKTGYFVIKCIGFFSILHQTDSMKNNQKHIIKKKDCQESASPCEIENLKKKRNNHETFFFDNGQENEINGNHERWTGNRNLLKPKRFREENLHKICI